MKRFVTLALIAFAGTLLGQAPVVLYGPYMQQAGPTSAYVSWRTDVLCDSKVNYGLVKNSLTLSAGSSSNEAQHFIQLNGLSPNTKYYYTIGTTGFNLVPDTFYFYTAPPFGSKQKTRVLAFGDCGTGYPDQIKVRDAVKNFIKNNYINCFLILGDNAYDNGLDNEFTTNFWTPYQNQFIFPSTCIYPAPGNHDYANTPALQASHAVPYYDIFKTPQNAELGGVPSAHKEFYSYNYANIHFISLDSYGIESGYRLSDTLSAQYTWLKQDLINNSQTWTVVYFHHPPYTMGNHNSDLEQELIDIRTNIAKLLDKYVVDLVINGHSHVYERSWLINGHYGLENSFSKPIHTVDSSSAKYDGSFKSCPYVKKGNSKGTVYLVTGNAGKANPGQSTFPHDAMYFSEANKPGALYFEVNDNRLDARYISYDSTVHDKFTIFKNVNNKKNLYFNNVQPFLLTASWPGNYNWVGQNNYTMNYPGTAISNTVIIVKDSLGCIADTFNIFPGTGINELGKSSQSLEVYPNPGSNEFAVQFSEAKIVKEIKLVNSAGTEHSCEYRAVSNGLKLDLSAFPSGAYTLKVLTSEGILSKKIIISK